MSKIKWTDDMYADIVAMHEAGATYAVIGAKYWICAARVGQVIEKWDRILRTRERRVFMAHDLSGISCEDILIFRTGK